MTRPLSRRDLVLLALIPPVGWGIHRLLAGRTPLGADLGDRPLVAALLADRAPPAREAAGATLTVVVFTGYQCPACKAAAPALERAAARDSKVRISYRDWPVFGPVSVRAARVAIAAAAQGIYPALHARLMAESRTLTDAVLAEAIAASGGDWPRALVELERRSAAIDRLLADTAQAAFQLGVTGTPAFLIGPVLVKGALDEEAFGRAFAEGREAGR